MRQKWLDSFIYKYDHPFTAYLAEQIADEDFGHMDDCGFWVARLGRHVIIENDRGDISRLAVLDRDPEGPSLEEQFASLCAELAPAEPYCGACGMQHDEGECDLDPANLPVWDEDSTQIMATDVMRMIEEDGLGFCASFEELHAHVDANMYLNDAYAAAAENEPEMAQIATDGGQPWFDALNAIADAVDARLKATVVETVTVALSGSEVALLLANRMNDHPLWESIGRKLDAARRRA